MFESPVSYKKEIRNFAPPGKKIFFLNLFDCYKNIHIYVWFMYCFVSDNRENKNVAPGQK